jgi:hypothetical protein
LEQALTARGVTVRRLAGVEQAASGDLVIAAAGFDNAVAREIRPGLPAVAEALALVPGKTGGRQVVLAAGHDVRGLTYALLELADRAQNATDAAAAVSVRKPVIETPANKIRSVTRLFTSDVEDIPWYNDREMWPQYLSMLAAQRFNRFHLSLGIGYDFLRNVTDAYFLFAYPFLLAVPGYNVRVPQITDAERDRNLEMLKFISEQTVARGMEFQLGLWMHGYEWLESPNPKHTIEGLNRDNHGPYCRDAVRTLLQACPAISGVTFRVHGESGVEEGSYVFWRTVFDGVKHCGRTVEIDMHAKGMDQSMIDMALATGQPVKISPKYWAEHMGMPYHQADIRELERPDPARQTSALMRFSAGSRSFLRYGYGDLLREDRKWGVLTRIWPGTQRLLLWGDPLTAAAHSRAFRFCGSDGVEIMEPLSFKGRRGSGIGGNRSAYRDAALRPRWDWQKYAYGHRVWGRLLYNPDSDGEVCGRSLAKQFGKAAAPAQAALANASRILPIVTTTHGASAANNNYWPEVYTNQSIVDAEKFGPYRDSPAPRVFGNVSPFDPQLFSRINDFADELVKGGRSGKYSPLEAAQWLEDCAGAASKHLAEAGVINTPEFRRLAIDVQLQAGVGRFFAAKFRSAVLYRIFEQTGDRNALEEALRAYRAARTAWAGVADAAKGVYVADITVGEHPQLRGHWMDRLPAIAADIQAMEAKLPSAKAGTAAAFIKEALSRPQRPRVECRHTPPPRYQPGKPLDIEFSANQALDAVLLHYRHVTQAERFQTVEMQKQDTRYRASIPGAYMESPYPVQYYFELKTAAWATLHPGFSVNLDNQPYYVVRRG